MSTNVLDTLVAQFTDPFACLRELIQNALDAGSDGVEVNTRVEKNSWVLEVQDHGSGMDRATIDNQLTRLFSSSKDGDLTKIGKFGIGFVSVFAIDPEAVCVDTSKAGERWRVVFDKSRNFTRVKLDEPMEGTRVRLFLSRATVDSHGGWAEVVRRARTAVSRWCRHVEREILFDGEVINQPLGLPSHKVSVSKDDGQGTVVVVGVGGDEAAGGIGFYNKGLTLLEAPTWNDTPRGVAVRISSRWLEHTLTRDSVVRDDRYQKAMLMVRDVVDNELMAEVLATLERLGTSEADAVVRAPLVTWLSTRKLDRAQKKRGLFCTADNRRVSIADLAGGEFCVDAFDPAPDAGGAANSTIADLAGLVGAAGNTVLLFPAGHLVNGSADLAALCGISAERMPLMRATFVALDAVDASLAPRVARLTEMTRALLKPATSGLFGGSSAGAGAKLCLRKVRGAVADRSRFFASADSGAVRFRDVSGRGDALVVNVDHEDVVGIVALAGKNPPLAAFLLAKMLLAPPVTADIDTAMAAAALQMQKDWQ